MSVNTSGVLKFESGKCKWWNKPLVIYSGRLLPAELVVLSMELRPGETGAWLNSRGSASGVADLVGPMKGKYSTKRVPVPTFVSEQLKRMYSQANVKRGCPDLVIWNPETEHVRLVEVKCPHWDRPSREQKQFIHAAESSGILAKIVEWEFKERTD